MLRGIISDIREFWVWLCNWLFYRRQSFKMGLAIRLADIKQMAFNKQYHVMILALPSGEKLVSVNNRDIERMKRKKWLPKKIKMLDLRDSIFYSTAISRNNKTTDSERKEAKRKYLKYSQKNKYIG